MRYLILLSLLLSCTRDPYLGKCFVLPMTFAVKVVEKQGAEYIALHLASGERLRIPPEELFILDAGKQITCPGV